MQYAQKLGADVAVTGVVQKVSNLILNISIYLRDVPEDVDKLICEARAARAKFTRQISDAEINAWKRVGRP